MLMMIARLPIEFDPTIPIQFNSESDDKPPTPAPVPTLDRGKISTTGNVSAQSWGSRNGGGNGETIGITALFPSDNASLDSSYQEKLTLSFQIKARDIKRIRVFFGLNGEESARSMTRGDAGSYYLSLANMPSGTYSWRFDVIIDNGDGRTTKKQSFGPWEFTLQGKQINDYQDTSRSGNNNKDACHVS